MSKVLKIIFIIAVILTGVGLIFLLSHNINNNISQQKFEPSFALVVIGAIDKVDIVKKLIILKAATSSNDFLKEERIFQITINDSTKILGGEPGVFTFEYNPDKTVKSVKSQIRRPVPGENIETEKDSSIQFSNLKVGQKIMVISPINIKAESKFTALEIHLIQ